MRIGCAALAGACLAAQAAVALAQPWRFPDSELEPVSFAALDRWAEDDHAAALQAFRKSCVAVLRRLNHGRGPVRPLQSSLEEPCELALELRGPVGAETARRFFEENFRPIRITKLGEREGFLTGYYEPEIEGRRTPAEGFSVPVYRKPADLSLRRARRSRAGAFPNSGKVGRRVGWRFMPYHDRAAIESGALKDRDLEICWVRDPVDLFFMQIQGSGRIKLDDGSLLRLNYVAHNGHPYLPIGRVLVDRGIVPRGEVTMDKIRSYLAEAPPDEARELMHMNRSFVFFREVAELKADSEAVGAQGISLTRERSIAVDKSIHAYGTLFWIEAELPLAADENAAVPFRRLMLAQDTGSAIVGPARADIYFGAGVDAGTFAGRLRHPGRFFVLVPRAADPQRETGVPLPPPRPAP